MNYLMPVDFIRPLKIVVIFILPIFMYACDQPNADASKDRQDSPPTKIAPNIILIYCDDLGYGDVGAFGSTLIQTPHLDKLAKSGLKLTDFYVASPVCSPSRAALLTGCYPLRVGIPRVLAPHGIEWAKDIWRHGLHPDEETLPELLKTKGYKTAIFGKWHLGHLPEHLPYQHGFDHFLGIPYSNDMYPKTGKEYPPLPLIKDTVVIEENPDQSTFTQLFTDQALNFMEQNQANPFFVYIPHPMPHVPIFASKKFSGNSENGLYGDVIEEIDASVGQIVQKLEDLKIRENTLIIFTSDNGPWLAYGNHAGSAGNLREGKHTTMEGGQRVPFIISWPGKIRPGESDELITNMDLLPTLAQWAGVALPEKTIDGLAMNDFFEGKIAKAGRKDFLYYYSKELQAMRSGNWKIHKPHTYNKIGENIGRDGERGAYDVGNIDWALFDLSNDPGEKNDLAKQYPQLMDSLKVRMLQADSLLQKELRAPFIYEGKTPKAGTLWEVD